MPRSQDQRSVPLADGKLFAQQNLRSCSCLVHTPLKFSGGPCASGRPFYSPQTHLWKSWRRSPTHFRCSPAFPRPRRAPPLILATTPLTHYQRRMASLKTVSSYSSPWQTESQTLKASRDAETSSIDTRKCGGVRRRSTRSGRATTRSAARASRSSRPTCGALPLSSLSRAGMLPWTGF
jgi:hypothetical protein